MPITIVKTMVIGILFLQMERKEALKLVAVVIEAPLIKAVYYCIMKTNTQEKRCH